MSFATCTSRCIGCKQIFSYNPVAVPSIVVKGQREPICKACIDRANPVRIASGLDPIVPLPNAYTACDESELPYDE